MIFNLATLHFGDVLMAMPAMRHGDSVIARTEHRVPGLDVRWLDGGGGLHPRIRKDEHSTDAWLAVTGRLPVKHRLMPSAERTLTVIAPDVAVKTRQWNGWEELGLLLADAVWIGAKEPREVWMALLNRAHTVICPDTGTAHMADALGVPRVIALHGFSENWPKCAPYWDRAHCVVRHSMAAISVDDVMERVNA